MTKAKVYIIGMTGEGASGLTARARGLINRAEMVFGGRRLLDMFPALKGAKVAVGHNLAEVAGLIERNMGGKRIVVLASGDPGFYGIAGYLTERLGKGRFEVVPHLSAMQLAFARIRESWEDAVFVSVHGRPVEDIVAAVRSHDKVGIFTDDRHNPSVIAGALLAQGVDGYRAYVCQDLGSRDEKIAATGLRGLLDREFSPLNVLVLVRKGKRAAKKPAARPGIPDGEFYRRRHREGLITKQEVRAVSLAKLRLSPDSVVWDIGAGSGAVSIEASLLATEGRVYAVEKNEIDVKIIRRNIRRFGVSNVDVVRAVAPDGLDRLPDPAAVFIGGSGGCMTEIIDVACRRLKHGGRIVINTVSLENLGSALNALEERGFTVEIAQVSIARSTGILELTRLEALNPVFVIAAGKPEGVGQNE